MNLSSYFRSALWVSLCLWTILLIATQVTMSAVPISSENSGHPGSEDAEKVLKETLGHGAIDGQLRAQYQICDSEVFRRIGATCLIIHALIPSEGGSPCSVWKFAGLNTYLVPEGRDSLRWQTLTGEFGLFKRSTIGANFPETRIHVNSIRRTAENEYEIRTRNGTIWRYQKGVLIAIMVPQFGELQIRCRGTFVESITMAGEQSPEVRVEYDDDLRPIKLFRFGIPIASFDWGPHGDLKRWTDQRGGSYTFQYTNHLVSEISYTGVVPARVEWQENSNWRRGDSKWPCPIHLSRFGDRRYRFSIESRGWITLVRDERDEELGEVCFNPATRWITVERDSHIYKVNLSAR